MGSPKTDDIVERAQAIYDGRLKAELGATHLNEYVNIEPESGDYFLGRTSLEAGLKARAAHPDRMGYVIRIGHRAAVFIGGSK